jgi:hypothetical protein
VSVGHFHIPGGATRREYAVYVMVARRRTTGRMHLYVGKTGDNKEGCNPVISRAGNHFSFNTIHSQMRNHLPAHPEAFDFDFFYTTFGEYVDPKVSRVGIDAVNEMERQLNRLVQVDHAALLLNKYEARTKLRRYVRDARAMLATDERMAKLNELLARVAAHVVANRTTAPITLDDSSAADILGKTQ